MSGQQRDSQRLTESETAFDDYRYAMTKRAALYLRAVAAELEQVRPQTDTPLQRRQRAAGCLQKIREVEELLGYLGREA